jgi:hypothetical protein
MLQTSKDGITQKQAKTFAKTFGLTKLRMEGGLWIANDGDEDSPYTISADNYWGAKNEGDLK